MKLEQKRVHKTLVERLRKPLSYRATENNITDKWNAIGEALAYIIEKKHAKRKIKKLGRKQKRDPDWERER